MRGCPAGGPRHYDRRDPEGRVTPGTTLVHPYRATPTLPDALATTGGLLRTRRRSGGEVRSCSCPWDVGQKVVRTYGRPWYNPADNGSGGSCVYPLPGSVQWTKRMSPVGRHHLDLNLNPDGLQARNGNRRRVRGRPTVW